MDKYIKQQNGFSKKGLERKVIILYFDEHNVNIVAKSIFWLLWILLSINVKYLALTIKFYELAD